jgi:secreted PhoX family phosphatase
MGDDSRGEYIYKFVSNAAWTAADAAPADRMATGDKYLDNGKLYVARFDADGSGQWIELSIGNPQHRRLRRLPLCRPGRRAGERRLAADAVGATRMDRPEWCAVQPGHRRGLLHADQQQQPPAGAVGFVADGAGRCQPACVHRHQGRRHPGGNVNGHILRLKEGAGSAGTRFAWDVYLFGAEASAAAGVNLSALSTDQDFSSPDGLAFSRATGICWIQTDDGAYTDVSNCMMLAALPGRQGDGGKRTLSYTRGNGSTLTVDTFIGQAPTADTLKRFLVGPVGSEITGMVPRRPTARRCSSTSSTRARTRRRPTWATRPSTPASGRPTPATAPAGARVRPRW